MLDATCTGSAQSGQSICSLFPLFWSDPGPIQAVGHLTSAVPGLYLRGTVPENHSLPGPGSESRSIVSDSLRPHGL